MSALIASIFGVVMSLVPELVPGFRIKWDALSNEWKRAVRAYVGAGIVALVAVLQYVSGFELGLPVPFDKSVLLEIILTWAAFVLSAEGTYQVAAPFLPRKQA